FPTRRSSDLVAVVGVSGPAGDAVDVAALQTGVADRLQRGIDAQLHCRAARRPTDLGLADAGDGDVLLEQACVHAAILASSRSNSGSQTSSICSKVTCTGMPTCTSSGAPPTMLT